MNCPTKEEFFESKRYFIVNFSIKDYLGELIGYIDLKREKYPNRKELINTIINNNPKDFASFTNPEKSLYITNITELSKEDFENYTS